MTMMMQNDNANNSANDMAMSDSSQEASMDLLDDSVVSRGAGDESDLMTSDFNDHAAEFTDNHNGNVQSTMDMD